MAQWNDRLQLQTGASRSGVVVPKRGLDREQELQSLQTPQKSSVLDTYGVIPGKITVIEDLSPRAEQELLQNIQHALRQSRTSDTIAPRLDKLPFQANTVADVLRRIGVPETRLRQLLLQMGLQSVEHASPQMLTPAQMQTLAVIASMHSPQQTVILSNPFRGLDPHTARTLSDFLVVSALEQKKSFVLINPGATVDSWKGCDWAVWQPVPHPHVHGKPFGGMNLNIPQELLELQMARSARSAMLESAQKKDDAPAHDHEQIEFLEEKLEKDDPFLIRSSTEQDRFRHLSQQTQRSNGKGFFSLPFLQRPAVAVPGKIDYFASRRRALTKTIAFALIGGAALLLIADFIYASL